MLSVWDRHGQNPVFIFCLHRIGLASAGNRDGPRKRTKAAFLAKNTIRSIILRFFRRALSETINVLSRTLC